MVATLNACILQVNVNAVPVLLSIHLPSTNAVCLIHTSQCVCRIYAPYIGP